MQANSSTQNVSQLPLPTLLTEGVIRSSTALLTGCANVLLVPKLQELLQIMCATQLTQPLVCHVVAISLIGGSCSFGFYGMNLLSQKASTYCQEKFSTQNFSSSQWSQYFVDKIFTRNPTKNVSKTAPEEEKASLHHPRPPTNSSHKAKLQNHINKILNRNIQGCVNFFQNNIVDTATMKHISKDITQQILQVLDKE